MVDEAEEDEEEEDDHSNESIVEYLMTEGNN